MTTERCDECGFHGDAWTDSAAIRGVAGLTARWRLATSGLRDDELRRRPIDGMWSIAEYADHVREVLFGMRFLLDSAVGQPGIDLGDAPETRFDPEPRRIDRAATLEGIDREATALAARLAELDAADWRASATLDGDEVDPRWIVRHAVHDATHHLLDVERLRGAL